LKNKLGHRILFFVFTYNYLGSIIGRICGGFLKDGANLIIHIANLASCREPEDIIGSKESVLNELFLRKYFNLLFKTPFSNLYKNIKI
jgi:hypothetical protein